MRKGRGVIRLFARIAEWTLPVVVGAIPLYGWLRGIDVFSTFVEGAEEGFQMAIGMIPFLVGMLVALDLFQASGAMTAVVHLLEAPLNHLGIPTALVPLMLVRPLSGGAALGTTSAILHRYGPDSYLGRLASVIQGSTDTTFYVVTLYFGAVGIQKVRHALYVALIGDLAGFVAAMLLAHRFFACNSFRSRRSATMATSMATEVARMVGATMSVGCLDPAATRSAITVAGTRLRAAVLTAIKVT
jgi:spore maturation protein B